MSALGLPEFTILSDQFNLQQGTVADQDLFALEARLRPVFDIIRHKDTASPLALALYGDAGTGKTTALHWLNEQIEQWNAMAKEERGGHVKALPVFFSATTCCAGGSAVQCLMREMIFTCLNNLPDESVRAELFGMAETVGKRMLGDSFLNELAVLGAQWGMDAESVEPTGLAYSSTTSYVACLAFAEAWQQKWAESGELVRLAVLMDDLDHCPVDQMMEMFDALSNPLKSKALIFVVALDQNIARKVVEGQYASHGFGEEEARRYLAKVFQGECQIEPLPHQVELFYEEQIKMLDSRMNGLLKTHFSRKNRAHIDGAILALSSGNPRKIKMLLNSAVMKAYTAYSQDPQIPAITIIRFAQRIQAYLLQRWFSHYPVGSSVIFRKDAQEWLLKLSTEARKPDTDFENMILVPQNSEADPYRRTARGYGESVDLTPPEGLDYSMIKEWVWELLKIPFDANMLSVNISSQTSSETAQAVAVAEAEVVDDASKEIIGKGSDALKQAMADSLGKDIDTLCDDDIAQVVNLDFSGKDIPEADFPIIAQMLLIQRLNMTCSQIKDLTPLSGLINLQQLDLSYTPVSDLAPLAGLEQLETLVLYGGGVQSLEGLRDMQSLQRLNLSHTDIGDDDLAVIETMPSMNHLFLRGTSVTEKRAAELTQTMNYAVRVEL